MLRVVGVATFGRVANGAAPAGEFHSEETR